MTDDVSEADAEMTAEPPPIAQEPVGSADDWRAGIANEKVRRFAGRFGSPADLAEAALGLRQRLSRSVTPPGRDAGDAERAAFRKALGVPDSADAYKADYPESLPAHLKPADGEAGQLGAFLEVAHEAGFSQRQVDAVLGWYFDQVHSLDGAQSAVESEAAEEARAELSREWGASFGAKVALASRAAEAFGGEAFAELAEIAKIDGVRLGDHPLFLRTFAAVGAAMREAEPLIGLDGEPGVDLERRHQELTERIADALDQGDRPRADRLDKQRSRISAQLVGVDPIVGSDGRGF